MTRYWLNVALVRILFPAILVACTIWRPVGLSLVYLALALVSPMIPVPTTTSMNGHTGRFLKASIALSLIVTITQIAFHIVLLSLPPYGHFLQNCEFLEKLLRHIGLVRLDSASAWEVFFWITPEIIVFPSSVLIYCIVRQLVKSPPREDDDNTSYQLQHKKSKERSAKIINFLGSIGTYVVLATLMCTAVLKPSIEGGFYFLVFIGSATWWAFHRELRRGFAFVCRVLMSLVAIHILALLTYQNQWPQELLPVNGTWARYLALQPVYQVNCTDPRDVEYVDEADWSTYAYSLRLFLLYFVLALQSKFLFKKPKPTPEPQVAPPNERTPLMRFGSGRTGLLQDSTGSVIVPDGQQDDSIQLQSLSEGVSEEKPGIIEHVIVAVFSIFQLVVNSSYLATNIIMMTWSIMYHSWTTFALLLWALILWMVPNKRASMMKCSPFIVFYSTILILIQYVYNMNLTEDELPSVINGVKMADIGFKKTSELSCWHLVIKCLFMTMFWITMRQYTAEKMRQRRSSALRDMVAPLHVSVSTATTAMNNQSEPEIKSKFMKDVGVIVKKFLTKFWIAVVAIMLFTSGITGEKMTVFRIVYMSLFLFFIITFQLSWTMWRKMMYGFWITVIGYSVIMLILVYTYQFPDFPEYWEKYLGITKNLQEDIGLIIYDTKDLFVRLLTPTFFVIITVIQIHYFHHDFLEATNIKRISETDRKDSLGHSPSTIPIVSPAEVFTSDPDDERHVYTLKQLKHMSKLERLALIRKLSTRLYNFYNHVWLFLEIHMQKIIFISFVLFCIDDVCAINFFFILTIAITINFRRTAQIMVINIMATAVAILMVTKMLYQIDYIKHDDWNRNCTETVPGNDSSGTDTITKTYNMAEWIGVMKTNREIKLPKLLEGYIGIITVTTIRAIIAVRQWFYRQENGEPLETPIVMFPKIKRVDADKGVLPCLKFLFNYGFYKFGLEICLMGIVMLIGTRLDFYSLLYSIWLMILFSLDRKTTSKVWPFLKVFAIVMLPFQYALVVAPPTWLCLDYPWKYAGKDEAFAKLLKGLQEWMYLPDPDNRPNSKKLMCDFILLLMIVRQSLVFRIEQRSQSTGREFIAGHNYSVYKDMEKPNFVNPVKDFVSHIHNYLDVFKRGAMMSLMWITLSIMFLAGTKRTNLFSLGYLIGAFVFLWQGSDFYLRPVKTILKWWNILIGYNIFVIFCKTIFQGIGCVFIQYLETYACWVIQLLGIACLNKFEHFGLQFQSSAKCEVDREDIGMVWDGLCFGFLLIQKRLFRSYYFFHIVDETKAMSILASRGAELLEELHQKRILEQENLEKAVLQKIKFKMDKIKASQRKIHGPNYREPKTHKIDTLYQPLDRPMYLQRAPKTHVQAVRSGDYYMFDDMDDDDLTDLFPEKDISEEDQPPRRSERRSSRMTVSELPEPESMSTQDEDATEREIDELDKTSDRDGQADEKSKEEGTSSKVSFLTCFKFLWALINSTMISMTRYLNRYSNDYRYVRKVLAKEKKVLKAKPDFRMGTRLGISQIWQPLPIVKQRSNVSDPKEDIVEDPGEGPSHKEDFRHRSSLFTHGVHPTIEEEEALLSEVDQPPIIQLAASIWFGILAHSTFLCYFMVFLHQIKNASILSTPLPLMVFLWGSLTIPRPSKTFWITIIAYIEVIVIIKCICQPAFLPWNKKEMTSYPFEVPRILGVERKTNYALWDLLLLLVVFFHRFMLKSLGQWTTPDSKLRKVIPTGTTIATVIKTNDGSGDKTQEENEQTEQPAATEPIDSEPTGAIANAENEIKTPKGMTLSLHLEGQGDGEDNLQPVGDGDKLVVIQATEKSVIDENYVYTLRLTFMKYLEPMKIFFVNILDSSGKEKTNVYAYMFLCDFLNFLLLIFGFSSFGAQQGDGGVAAYFAENRVPIPFLLMLLLQFALIVIDRALFLKKSIGGKLAFQYFLVVGVHIWMFIILPSATERQFNTKVIPQIWYMVKCFYLLLAAYQLRLGYPTRILGNFLCKKYTIVNYTLFKGFMLVPLLFEMRAVMDWIWTDTSMTVMDWFKMEDIFANVYQLKCMRGLENDYPAERGIKKPQTSKYLVGGFALFLMIGIIWFPLLFFALGSTVGISNLPNEVRLNVRIGAYVPIYQIAAQNNAIIPYSETDFNDLRELYEVTRRDRAAVTFLENYINTDVAAVKLGPDSGKLWEISPPDRHRLINELKSNDIVTMHIEWIVLRKPAFKEDTGITSNVKEIPLPAFVDGKFNQVRKDLIEALTGKIYEPNVTATSNSVLFNDVKNKSVYINDALPMFLKVTSRSVTIVPQLVRPLVTLAKIPADDDEALKKYLYRNITLIVSNNSISEWFTINENCENTIYNTSLNEIPLNDCSYIMMFLFNDKVFPDSLSFLSGLGIFGLYTTFVILVSGMIKKMVSDMAPKIMFEDLPYVDRILRLCLDIYLVRESGDLCLEEDLFAKLVFLYRSPETLIRWTRPPEPGEQADDDDDQNYNEIDSESQRDDGAGEESEMRRRTVA